MIQVNAKCVVNGPKVNEIAGWVNQFIKLTQEEIDIVDTGNTPGKRWFLTGRLAGDLEAGASEDGDRNNLGGTSGGSLGSSGGGAGNLDKLDMGAGRPIAPGNAGVAPRVNISTGRPIAPGGMTAKQAAANFLAHKQRAAGVDEFGNTIGGSGRGALVDDGMTAKQAAANFMAHKQRAAGTTPAPLPGAPPLGGDTTPAPLPGAPPLGGDTTPAPLPGAPPPNQPATTPTEASPTADAASDAATSTAGDTTASKDGEFVDWREAEKARIKSRMKTLSSRVSADSSPEQIADVRESLSRLIKEYERVSKM